MDSHSADPIEMGLAAAALRALVAGCVAVSLLLVAAVALWIADGLARASAPGAAFVLPAAFAGAFAIRGVGESLRRVMPFSPRAPMRVIADLAVLVVCVLLVGAVAYVAAPDQFRLYGLWSLTIAVGFLLPAALAVFIATELVLRSSIAIRSAIIVAMVAGASWLVELGLSVVR
jgi:hypothetical protein